MIRTEAESCLMGWIVAILVVGLAIAGLVGGTVLHPIIYGLFVAAIIIIPLALVSSLFDAILKAIFGKRQ